MRGWLPEALIICGTYLLHQTLWLGITFLVVGIFSGFVKFVINQTRLKVRDDILLMFHGMIQKISLEASKFENEKFGSKSQETIH